MSRFKYLFLLILTTLNINSLKSDVAFVDYEITVLATNISNYGGFGEWSFSALYESEQESVLFDTGFHEDTVLHNAKILEKDLSIWNTLGLTGEWSRERTKYSRIQFLLEDGEIHYNDIS